MNSGSCPSVGKYLHDKRCYEVTIDLMEVTAVGCSHKFDNISPSLCLAGTSVDLDDSSNGIIQGIDIVDEKLRLTGPLFNYSICDKNSAMYICRQLYFPLAPSVSSHQ